jgi:hypothetical protein
LSFVVQAPLQSDLAQGIHRRVGVYLAADSQHKWAAESEKAKK